MRAQRTSPEQRAAQPPRQPFSQALDRARASRAAAHAAESERLRAVRAEARAHGEGRAEERALELIGRELKRDEAREEPAARPAPGEAAAPRRSGPAAEPAAPGSRAEAALGLVERIEVFLRSGRPQLELSVGGAFQAAVLLERTAPGQVAVTIRGTRGAPPPGELARLREQLQARGLKVASLTVTCKNG